MSRSGYAPDHERQVMWLTSWTKTFEVNDSFQCKVTTPQRKKTDLENRLMLTLETVMMIMKDCDQ